MLKTFYMFWLVDPKPVIWTHNNEPEPTNDMTWRARKGLMEVMRGRTWPHHGMDRKAKKTQEYVLQTLWQDYVPDKFGRRDAILPKALTVPKSVFSNAMTVMDKVEGWDDEEKWVGSKYAACMCVCDGRGSTPEDLRRKLEITRECVGWVCEDVMWEHEWVTELNVILKENENLEALNYDLDVLCLIQRGLLWFSSHSPKIHKQWHKNRKLP